MEAEPRPEVCDICAAQRGPDAALAEPPVPGIASESSAGEAPEAARRAARFGEKPEDLHALQTTGWLVLAVVGVVVVFLVILFARR
jgi:hypothetical protein